MSADTFCPKCGYGPLQDGVPERIRELEAYLAAQEQAATELMTDKDIYIRELEAELDRLRELCEKGKVVTTSSIRPRRRR